MQHIKNIFRWLARRLAPDAGPRSSPDHVSRLLRQLQQTQDKELACDEALDLIDRYAEMIQRGEDAQALMPLVRHHLDMCPDCREEFEALLRVLKAMPA